MAGSQTTGTLMLHSYSLALAPGKVIIRNNIVEPKAGTHTTLNFKLTKVQKVTITVYDLAGRPVKVLYNRTGNIGLNEVIWDGKNRDGRTVVPGVYYIVVLIDKERYVHKVLVAR
jgi:flagellar hook assembly protein FlgD